MKLLLWVVGFFLSAFKFLPNLLFNQEKRKEWTKDNFGLTTPMMLDRLRRLKEEPRRWTHHITGYTVDWNRENGQRGMKMLAFIVVLQWLILSVLVL